MDTPPAKKPTQAERHHALRQLAGAGDLEAQAKVAALNAITRRSTAKAAAEGRSYWTAKARAARKAKRVAALQALPAAERPAAQQQLAEKEALAHEQYKAYQRALNRAYREAWRQRLAASDPAAVVYYEKIAERNRLAYQKRALKASE